MTERTFCAQACREEPIIGSATQADTWLLLEYTGTWHHKAVEESTLSESVKEWVTAQRQALPRLRVQLIKQHNQPVDAPRCFVVVACEGRFLFYTFGLRQYEDLLTLDIADIARHPQRYQAHRTDEPLYLVCTHGKHDQCCAKFGLPIYNELRALVGEQAWQTSHLGGDKFAANLVCFPHAIYYGHVTRSDVPRIVEAYRQEQIYLAKYRGQSCYNAVEQAADYFLRRACHNNDLQAFRLVEARQESESLLFSIVFQATGDESRHTLTLVCEPREVTSYSTCKGIWRHTITYYHLRHYSHAPLVALS